MKRYARLRISSFIAFLAILNASIFAPIAPCYAGVLSEGGQTSAAQETMSNEQHEGHGDMSGHSLHSTGQHEAAAGGHCGVMADDEEEFPATPAGHQCTHHTATASDSETPSLYCNCHGHGPDGAVNASAQEYRYLESATVVSLQQATRDAVQPFMHIFISSFHLDPIEKPPTVS